VWAGLLLLLDLQSACRLVVVKEQVQMDGEVGDETGFTYPSG
jgi:hypothetical protein